VQVTYRPYQGDAGEILGVVVLVNDVTEQHEAALELRRREAEFRAIFELNATGCAQVDMTTERFTRVNQKFCELTGYTREELLQKSFTDVTHPEDRGAERILVENAYRNGAENWEFEKRYVRKDGGIRWVLVRGTFLRDASGEAKQTVATITDLTEWKEHQRALTESETRYRQALEAGQFGAWEWLLPENRVHWSERLYAIHGVSPSEFKNTTEFFKAMVHPDDWDRVHHVIQMIQEGRPTHGVEYRMIRPDGEQRWLWTTATAFFEGKQPIKMVGITTDITERKKIELQLRESEERLRLAQRAAKVGTWDLHLDTQQFVWSEGMFDLLGIPAWHTQPNVEQALKLVHPEDQAKVEALLPELVARGGAFNTEFRVIRPNGDVRWLLSMGKIESGENQRPVRMLGVTVDITERKKAEELLQSQAQELEALVRARTERLQEVIMDLESFSYTVAHDLRGPLRAMNGFATALEEDYGSKLDEQGHEYTRRITRSAERMDRLICDVLDYSKITRATFEAEPVPLEPLLQGIIESYPALQNPETAITLEKPLPVVLGTSSLVVQCFSNLIGNAVKFVPAGTPPRVRVWADQVNNGTVKIWVEDNGVGVAPENYERIFGLFQRLDKNYEGTGIGLAIVARAVERMGGKVGIEPAPERGTRFWVELKAAPDKG
jgi:PAS domain S-box-containing protein